MASLSDIYNFIAESSGVKGDKLTPDTDLYKDIGIDGDDFFELEAEYEKRFSVNMSNYRWYFHHGEEGSFNIGALLFKPPYSRVTRIPITPELLLQSANAHSWLLSYPKHELPRRRLDLLFNLILLGSIGIVGVVLLFLRWLHV